MQAEIEEVVRKVNGPIFAKIDRLTQLVESMAKADQPGWVTPKQAAQILKVSERTIRTRIQEGRFDIRREGARVRIRYADLIKSQG